MYAFINFSYIFSFDSILYRENVSYIDLSSCALLEYLIQNSTGMIILLLRDKLVEEVVAAPQPIKPLNFTAIQILVEKFDNTENVLSTSSLILPIYYRTLLLSHTRTSKHLSITYSYYHTLARRTTIALPQ